MDSAIVQQLPMKMIFYILLVIGICIHEWAHAFTADKLKDPLPRAQGRVTLNPIAHMDFWGTFVIPMLMIFMSGSFFLIGWGKPVMVSLPHPKTRVRDDLLITAAGPLSNLILAFLAAFIGLMLSKYGIDMMDVIYPAIMLNCTLVAFNLLPIPPLDGSHFLKYAIGMSEETYYKFAQWGFLILLVLINIPMFRGFLGSIIKTLVALVLTTVY